MDVAIGSAVEDKRLPDLLELFRSAWWTADRGADEVAQMLQQSDIITVLTDRPTNRLVGFARVLTDYTYVALVLDVVVSEAHRGSGLGARLLDAVVHHPALATVRSLELVCQPELVPFYRQWGFTDEVGRSLLMRRTSDARLTT
ncbi:GNAT family N-acetyltransferase [Kribbella sp. NPDC049174]|uniref:GNAT family N-acetyltransferase n=1 Tax=Kribbella sp. NPDC049174 TaxID=3364112 RepID=UPI00371422AC